MRFGTAAWIMGVVGSAAPTLAGPLNKAWVGADAKWVVHVDVEAAMGSTVGKCFVEHRKELDLQPLDQFNRFTGLDALKDIKGVTVYGQSPMADAGVVVVVGTANIEESVKRLATQDKTVQKLEADGRTVYQWHEHGEDRFGCLRTTGESDRMLIVSNSRAELDSAIAVVEGTAEAAAKVTEGSFAANPRAGSVVFLAVRGLDAEMPGPKVLRTARELNADIGEDAEGLYGDMRLKAATSIDAKNTADFLQGLVAMARMAVRSDPQAKQLATMMDSVSFEAKQEDLTATIRVKHERLKALVDEVRAERLERMKGQTATEKTDQENPKK